jgi:hypothetical protein
LATYLYCGLPIVSNIVISELIQIRDRKGVINLTYEYTQDQAESNLWTHHWQSPDGESVLSYRSQGTDQWLRFPGSADFRLSARAREVFCYPLPGIPIETLRHLVLDQVLPRCLAHQGKIMVHASAVQFNEGVALFLGDSGTGKSTLAGSFHQAGWPAVSDDCLCIKNSRVGVKAIPSYASLRLWDDSLNFLFPSEGKDYSVAHYSTKKRISTNGYESLRLREGIPILAVFVLSPPTQHFCSDITMQRISHREAFIELMRQSFKLNFADLRRVKRHIGAIGRIIPELQAFRLSVPRQYDLLPAVRQKVLEKIP